MRQIWYLSCAALIAAFAYPIHAASSTTDTSFQLSPAPIPYPNFTPGATDGKIDLSYIKMTIQDYTLNGLSVFGKGRKAFTDMLAVDAMLGLMYLGGQMPGVGPIALLPAYSASGSFLGYYTPISATKSTFSSTNISIAGNLELQAIRTPAFAMILFGGVNMNVTNMSFKTPYNLYYAATGTTYTGYTDQLSMSLLLGGFQAGLQVDIPLGSMIRVSPFVVMTTTSGSGTMKDEPGVKTSGQTSFTYEVQSSTAYSTGFDIFINDISIGAMAQSGKSAQTGNNNSYLQLTVGFRFGSEPAAEEEKGGYDGWSDEEAAEGKKQ